MIKRFVAWMLIVLLIASMPMISLAEDAKMEEGVPVWTEETVRQYALDYIGGKSMERLYHYYDAQLIRYTPLDTFSKVLVELEFMTGDFVSLGSYSCFSEPEYETKTHILHLCMEEMDVEMYFTHKDQADDWEVMALDFVPAEKETPTMSEEYELFKALLAETMQIGAEGESLTGILTLPADTSKAFPVPVCVLVHDRDALDADSTLGETTFFADLAEALGEMGVATLRYDSRNLVYGDQAGDTVFEEVVQDAIFAGKLLQEHPLIDSSCIAVLGLGYGAELCPRIVSQSDGIFKGMIMVGAKMETQISQRYTEFLSNLVLMSEEESNELRDQVRYFDRLSEEEASELTLFGENGSYFYDLNQYTPRNLIGKLQVPTYILQGREDPLVSEEEGWEAYKDAFNKPSYITYESMRGLNHILMNDLSAPYGQEPTYSVQTSLDIQAGRNIALWILSLAEKES